MTDKAVHTLESELGCGLPADYRAFLVTHKEKLLDPPLQYPVPGAEPTFGSPVPLDYLFTADDILENSRLKAIGIPHRHLMAIGSDLLGAYLYMSVADAEFGYIYVGKPLEGNFYYVADSFTAFRAACQPLAPDEQSCPTMRSSGP
jgi:SMI1 / KNR4 family (SUKH-1)